MHDSLDNLNTVFINKLKSVLADAQKDKITLDHSDSLTIRMLREGLIEKYYDAITSDKSVYRIDHIKILEFINRYLKGKYIPLLTHEWQSHSTICKSLCISDPEPFKRSFEYDRDIEFENRKKFGDPDFFVRLKKQPTPMIDNSQKITVHGDSNAPINQSRDSSERDLIKPTTQVTNKSTAQTKPRSWVEKASWIAGIIAAAIMIYTLMSSK